MWFADVGVWIGGAFLAGLAVLLTWVAVRSRPGRAAAAPAFAGRRPVLLGTSIAVLLFATQAGVVDGVEDVTGAGLLDRATLAWFVAHRTAAATGAMTVVSDLGGTAGMAVLAVVGAALLWWARHRVEAGVVLVAALGAAALVTGFKDLYDRARPPVADRLAVEANASLPSGHALGSVVVLGVLAAVVVVLTRRVAAQVVAVALAVAAIGVSRLYLGVHWMTDVLTGWLLGGAWLALCVMALAVLPRHHAAGERLSRAR